MARPRRPLSGRSPGKANAFLFPAHPTRETRVNGLCPLGTTKGSERAFQRYAILLRWKASPHLPWFGRSAGQSGTLPGGRLALKNPQAEGSAASREE